MDDRVRQGYLYDFYGELLNEHQRSVFEAYVCQDLSLGEIAAETGVSRQSVFDLLKRCTKTLEEYECRLHLINKFMIIREKISEIHEITNQVNEVTLLDDVSRIGKISNDILEEL